jgi:hypothetical protein
MRLRALNSCLAMGGMGTVDGVHALLSCSVHILCSRLLVGCSVLRRCHSGRLDVDFWVQCLWLCFVHVSCWMFRPCACWASVLAFFCRQALARMSRDLVRYPQTNSRLVGHL